MPTNIYGPNDNYDLESGHVLTHLFKRFHDAKRDKKEKVEIWGTGKPKREFIHVDDVSEADLFCN